MKKILTAAFNCIFVLLFALHFARPVFAHGGEPRLEISADRLNPGEVLQVRGVDFEYEEEVAISLLNSTTDVLIISLGTIIADIEGGFNLNVTLPGDVPEGVYIIRATTYDHETTSPPFTVLGTAIVDQESGVIRDQSDVEFQPLTALAPGVGPTAVSPVTSPARSASNPEKNVMIISVIALLGILLVFGPRMMKKQ